MTGQTIGGTGGGACAGCGMSGSACRCAEAMAKWEGKVAKMADAARVMKCPTCGKATTVRREPTAREAADVARFMDTPLQATLPYEAVAWSCSNCGASALTLRPKRGDAEPRNPGSGSLEGTCFSIVTEFPVPSEPARVRSGHRCRIVTRGVGKGQRAKGQDCFVELVADDGTVGALLNVKRATWRVDSRCDYATATFVVDGVEIDADAVAADAVEQHRESERALENRVDELKVANQSLSAELEASEAARAALWRELDAARTASL